MHHQSGISENNFNTQVNTCLESPVSMSLRQNFDTNEKDFSILKENVINRDELMPPPVVHKSLSLLHGITNDELKCSGGSNQSALYIDTKEVSSVTRFDTKDALDAKITLESSHCDLVTLSGFLSTGVYGNSFSAQREIPSVQKVVSLVESSPLETNNDKRGVTNVKYHQKNSSQGLCALIKKQVKRYFESRQRRITSQQKRRLIKNTVKCCL